MTIGWNQLEGDAYITQSEQDINPKVIPTNLDLWDSKVGKVLKLEK